MFFSSTMYKNTVLAVNVSSDFYFKNEMLKKQVNVS